MPLEKSSSKAAFGHNIGVELKAKKPQKQAVAIAFSEKRAAEKPTKAMKFHPTKKPKAVATDRGTFGFMGKK